MNYEIEDVIEDIRKISMQNPDIETTIVFGSVARGKAGKESDVDVCIILSGDSKEDVSNQLLNIEKKHDRNINAIFTDKTFKSLDRQFIETILREGIVIYGKMPEISVQRLELEPYEIIRFDLSNLSQPEKMRVKKLLYGIKTKKEYKGKIYESEQKGLVEKFGGLRIGIASILIPEKMSWKVEEILREYGVNMRKITIWLSKP